MSEKNNRVMHQYGWITGPVECRCSCCSWAASFIAVNGEAPQSITLGFTEHDCSEFYALGVREERTNDHEKISPDSAE
jgi:hypothetical protein